MVIAQQPTNIGFDFLVRQIVCSDDGRLVLALSETDSQTAFKIFTYDITSGIHSSFHLSAYVTKICHATASDVLLITENVTV